MERSRSLQGCVEPCWLSKASALPGWNSLSWVSSAGSGKVSESIRCFIKLCSTTEALPKGEAGGDGEGSRLLSTLTAQSVGSEESDAVRTASGCRRAPTRTASLLRQLPGGRFPSWATSSP